MKRCLTLGISLCLLALLSGCCCGRRCGGGCYAPSSCSPCAQPFGGFAPMGGCSSCGPGGGAGFGGAPVYGTPGTGIPSTYVEPYGFGQASLSNGTTTIDTVGLPPASGMPATAYAQPQYVQSANAQPIYGQPMLGQPASFGQAPVTAALVKPESLATY